MAADEIIDFFREAKPTKIRAKSHNSRKERLEKAVRDYYYELVKLFETTEDDLKQHI